MSGKKDDSNKEPAAYFYFQSLAECLGDNKGLQSDIRLPGVLAHNMESLMADLVVNNQEYKILSIQLFTRAIVSELKRELGQSEADVYKTIGFIGKLGADKYGIYNYQKGMKWSRLLNALGRHLIHYMVNDIIDEESGYDHRYHMLANLLMLAYYVKFDIGENDLIEGVGDE